MDRSLLTRSPTDYEHLGSFVTTNAMTPVITFLETKVRCEILFGNVDVGKPGIDLFQFRRRCSITQLPDQIGKRQ